MSRKNRKDSHTEIKRTWFHHHKRKIFKVFFFMKTKIKRFFFVWLVLRYCVCALFVLVYHTLHTYINDPYYMLSSSSYQYRTMNECEDKKHSYVWKDEHVDGYGYGEKNKCKVWGFLYCLGYKKKPNNANVFKCLMHVHVVVRMNCNIGLTGVPVFSGSSQILFTFLLWNVRNVYI